MSDTTFTSPLLAEIDARGREELLRAAREQDFREGEYAYRAGDEGDAVFVCLAGAFEVEAPGRDDQKPRHVRDAITGDAFGEEALLPFSSRQSSARAKGAARVLALPAHLVRRALSRAGKDSLEDHVRRRVMRALSIEAVTASASFTGISSSERDAIVDACQVRDLARGDYLFRKGDDAKSLFLVAAGTFSIQVEENGRPKILAYLSRGDAIGDGDLGGKRRATACATGPARVVEIDARVVDANVKRRPAFTRLTIAPKDLLPTAHLLRDKERFELARSMLAIDSDSCVRCGHCSSACASVHDDGASRLLRSGEKFEVPSIDATLILPTSCQHCKNPACMPECPTGAIAREASGEITIRADLCTGCGACAKACPWDNIAMSPRGKAPAPPGMQAHDLAVKCDLCATRDAGPACVASCPVSAIVRIEPSRVIPELGGAPENADFLRPRRVPIAALLGVFAFSLLLARAHVPFTASGIVAFAVMAICAAYMGMKRVAFRFAKSPKALFAAGFQYAIHLAFGAVLPGIAIAHSRGHIQNNPAGVAFVALMMACASGAALSVFQRVLPRIITRAERRISNDGDLAEDARDLERRLHASLTQKSALTKTLYERVLRPYDDATFGAFAFAFSRLTMREERARLGLAIDLVLGGRGKETRHEIDDAIAVVVERRALRAKRIALVFLRSDAVVHVAATAVAIACLLVHAFEALQ